MEQVIADLRKLRDEKRLQEQKLAREIAAIQQEAERRIRELESKRQQLLREIAGCDAAIDALSHPPNLPQKLRGRRAEDGERQKGVSTRAEALRRGILSAARAFYPNAVSAVEVVNRLKPDWQYGRLSARSVLAAARSIPNVVVTEDRSIRYLPAGEKEGASADQEPLRNVP